MMAASLRAAFDTGDMSQVEQLYKEMRRDGVGAFHLNTTIPDLKYSLNLQKKSERVIELQKLIADLEGLLN